RIGKVRSQEAQLHAAGPVRADDVIGSASEHPGERGVRSGHIRKSRLRNCGVQVRKAKLHLAEGMQSVLVNLPATEENARPEQVILQMRLGGDRAAGSELESADAGVVPGGVVIRGNHHFVGEVPAGAEIEAVRAKVAGDVRPPAVQLETLRGGGSGQHGKEQEKSRQGKGNNYFSRCESDTRLAASAMRNLRLD